MKLILETERLLLRPFELSDAQAMFDGWTSDPEVSKYMIWNAHETVAEAQSLISLWLDQYEKPERLNFAIVNKSDGRLIGGIDVVGYENGVPIIGYNLAREYWGRGLMTEACKCVCGYLFSHGFDEIHIDAVCENIGSVRVIEKCGGRFIGTDEEYFPMKNKTFTVSRFVIRQHRTTTA